MTGIIKHITSDKKAIMVELSSKTKYHLNDCVEIKRKHSGRTLSQNSFYWLYLSWLINPEGGNLKEQGHFSVSGLHEDFKEWYKETYKHDLNTIDFSTADLNTYEFCYYFERINLEVVNMILNVDTSPFLKEYEDFKQNLSSL